MKRLNKTQLLVIYLFDLCCLNSHVYILKTEWYLDLYIAYVFLNERILQTSFENVCMYPGFKYETLLCIWVYIFFSLACFYIIFVC